MAAEIVKAGAALPSHEQLEQELDRLESSGDTQALNEVARQAAAHQEYETRNNATERASYFGRIKVMAEARIGAIDLDLHPTPGTSTLEFDGWVVSRCVRGRWRLMGAGLQVGQFDKAVASVEARDEVVSTTGVAKELSEIGALWVATAPLLKRYRHLYQTEGLTIREVEQRSGVKGLGQYLTRPGTKPYRDKIRRHAGLRVARALGVDPHTLKPARSTKAPHHKRRRMRKQRALLGGRLDETYTLIRKALTELDRAAGQSKWGTDEAYDHLYKAEEIVGRALRRAT